MTTYHRDADRPAAPPREAFRADERGAAAVELALVGPILFMILFAILEFGVAAYGWSTATDGARFGARFAAVRSSDSGRPTTQAQVQDSVRGRLGSTRLNVTVAYRNAAGTAAGSNTVGQRVRVTVSYPYTKIFRFIPTGNITSTAESVIMY